MTQLLAVQEVIVEGMRASMDKATPDKIWSKAIFDNR
jgi:hypothetical protein